MSAETTKLELLATSLRDIPDVLVAIKLDLKPLCEGKIEGVPDAAKTTLEDACAMLNKSIGRVMAALEYIDGWTEGVGDQTRPPLRVASADGSGESDQSHCPGAVSRGFSTLACYRAASPHPFGLDSSIS